MELKNKSVIFLGDSITQGHGTSAPDKVFHQLIGAKYGLKSAYNAGIGGTRIARQTTTSSHVWDLYFEMRVELLPSDADMIVVFGGTNDYGHGDAKMGDPDSKDIYTFFGGLNLLYESLRKKFPEARLVFMTPLERKNQTEPQLPENKILEDYVNAIRSFCDAKKVDCIDLFASKVLDPYDHNLVPDGLHPSDAGHAAMAEYIAEKLLEL